MVIYRCDYCNFLSNIKCNYKRHLNTNKHYNNIKDLSEETKKKINEYTKYTQSIHKDTNSSHKNTNSIHKNTNSIDKVFTEFIECDYCDKKFMSKQSMYRHKRHFCKLKNKNNQNLEDLKLIVKEQNKQITKLIDKVGTTNITQNNINNIQLNNYGKEDISYITDQFKTNLLKGPYNMIPKLIEQVHFNKNKPENKNILFPNKKDNKIKIFTGNKWIYKNKDEVINDLVDGKYFILDTHFDNSSKDELNNFNKNIYEKFRDLFDLKDNKLHQQIKKDCELVILNNR